ncbi:MAG: ThiF family adenylyltransferase [Erysipelotrichaceae bacterium]
MDKQYERISLFLKEEGLNKLQAAKVLIVGIGGVGGYAAEALARTGIGHLVLMDHDVVSESNLNRQIFADYTSINQAKCEVMKKRIQSFSKTKVTCIQAFYNEETTIIDEAFDYVIDACDTLSAKVSMVEACKQKTVSYIGCLGMANRIDPSKIIETTLDKTENDPLAKAFRQIVRKKEIKGKIKVVASKELPFKQNTLVNPEGKTLKDKYPPASLIFVPAAAGLLLASIVTREIVERT